MKEIEHIFWEERGTQNEEKGKGKRLWEIDY